MSKGIFDIDYEILDACFINQIKDLDKEIKRGRKKYLEGTINEIHRNYKGLCRFRKDYK